MLYALLHQLIFQEIEGDKLYTKVEKNKPSSESQEWTIVLMERVSRFLWELHCGRKKDQQLFKKALNCLVQVIEQTGSLSLFTDKERRYGKLLFEICSQVIRNGKLGFLSNDCHSSQSPTEKQRFSKTSGSSRAKVPSSCP